MAINKLTSGLNAQDPAASKGSDVAAAVNALIDQGEALSAEFSSTSERHKLLKSIERKCTASFRFADEQYGFYDAATLTFRRTPAAEAMTCVRASTATANHPQGLVTYPTNGLRIEYDPATGERLGLLCEGQRTNLVSQSESFTTSAWNKQNGSALSSTEISPIGATANVFQANGTSIPWFEQSISYTSGVFYVASIFVKAREINQLGFIFSGNTFNNGGSNLSATFNLLTGQVISNTTTFAAITPYPNGWYRISAGHNATLSITNGSSLQWLRFSGSSTAVGSGVFLSGAQVEAGSFPTSYIKTGDSQVTRSADRNELNPAHNENEFTVYGEFFGAHLSSVARAMTVGTAATNRIELINTELVTQIGGDTTRVITVPGGIVATQRYIVAYKFIDGVVTLVVNGIIAGRTAQSVNRRFASTGIRLSNNVSGSAPSIITFAEAGYYPRALSDQELIELTRL